MTFCRFGLLLVLGVGCDCARAGEAAWSAGLSDRELAIQRWFSALTFQADRRADPWPEWHDDGKQLDVTSLRYQLAFCGYGCAAMAARTPAYRELVQRQLLDLCERMIDVRVWYFVTKYWQYGDGPPDPCRYENVMYTGHLTQLMCLYEHLTGDGRYSTAGWDFVWRDGRKIHYRLERAIERLYRLSGESATGGICCEPGLVFADCNSHSSNSFLLYDLLHGTRYARANDRWFGWMARNFRNRMPFAGTYLYIVYRTKDEMFLPVGDPGADAWALGWGYPWFPEPEFAVKGWRFLRDHAQWISPEPDQLYVKNNPVVGCCGGGTLPVSNAFLPLAGVQAEGAESPTVRKILNWLEANYGRGLDLDGDGHEECYSYHTCDAHRISATGNIAAALATDGDSLRRLFRTSRRDLLTAPAVARVDYPNIYVRAAEYIAPVLRFVVTKGRPGHAGPTEVVCENIPGAAQVTRDGKPFEQVRRDGTKLTIRTDVEGAHAFEVRLASGR